MPDRLNAQQDEIRGTDELDGREDGDRSLDDRPDAEGDGRNLQVHAGGIADNGRQPGAAAEREGAADDEEHARTRYHDEHACGRGRRRAADRSAPWSHPNRAKPPVAHPPPRWVRLPTRICQVGRSWGRGRVLPSSRRSASCGPVWGTTHTAQVCSSGLLHPNGWGIRAPCRNSLKFLTVRKG